jgi:glycosyltransferase involved in cell wall biosynthesis
MAAHSPVIGSDVGGIPDMVENGITGFLVPPGDEAALTVQLCWMLDHPDKTHEMGGYAHAFAARFFSTKAYIRHYGEIFETAETLLTRKDRHAPSPL